MATDFYDLLLRAEQGEAAAQFAVANAYHQGLVGVGTDLAQAIAWYERAAYQDHVDALVNLGIVYATQLPYLGEENDPERAHRYFERAAALGDAQAMYYLGRHYLEGVGVARDTDRGVELLTRAADAGAVEALSDLGAHYLEGQYVASDPVLGVELLRRGAEAGDERSQYNLAIAFLTGNGVQPQMEEALRLLRAAAESGYAPAQHNLGALLTTEIHDAESGVRWFLEAGRSGDVNGQFEVAQAYRLGRGVEADLEAALLWYRSAAQQGHEEACFNLALMLEKGMGLDHPHYEEAEHWYQAAATKGHGGAAHNLGIMFAQGSAGVQDLELAVELFEYAVSLGNDEAMFSAGLACAHLGRLQQAVVWALLSIRQQPSAPGEQLLGRLQRDLDPGQLAIAERRASEWLREPKNVSWQLRSQAN